MAYNVLLCAISKNNTYNNKHNYSYKYMYNVVIKCGKN